MAVSISNLPDITSNHGVVRSRGSGNRLKGLSQLRRGTTPGLL
jgi:hypothetical protein